MATAKEPESLVFVEAFSSPSGEESIELLSESGPDFFENNEREDIVVVCI